ncbi:hypothetical protein DYB25_004325 [Aphanomyces astaci]|uniref:Mediator of RNA polymerase II transcription subunit 21 n=1 Tax=Aphanomyces astaci TaxID=112090 RepID=A0A397CJW4_APHAT|nr:hypothetical protein DYB25_004325 [Aphanomyces astaci]RHY43367.1 hypothetical protein DYB38_003804 [Aphanomyces astaci]RHY47264.1 hypothetical protein DYB30_004215 [Aphanomyces astaci]RHY53537.1 hypothetical protein DYB34_004001 [Aphanomyces astaci]RHZ10276.1 hypothetical protein DYB26_002900 [Aphanomyces astaci]
MDKVTVLQQCVDQMTLDMFNALRLLPPLDTEDDSNAEVVAEQLERIKGLAKDLLLSAKRTNEVIDTLPGLDKTEADQLEELRLLQLASDEEARNLLEAEAEALQWNARAHESLQVICDTRLKKRPSKISDPPSISTTLTTTASSTILPTTDL